MPVLLSWHTKWRKLNYLFFLIFCVNFAYFIIHDASLHFYIADAAQCTPWLISAEHANNPQRQSTETCIRREGKKKNKFIPRGDHIIFAVHVTFFSSRKKRNTPHIFFIVLQFLFCRICLPHFYMGYTLTPRNFAVKQPWTNSSYFHCQKGYFSYVIALLSWLRAHSCWRSGDAESVKCELCVDSNEKVRKFFAEALRWRIGIKKVIFCTTKKKFLKCNSSGLRQFMVVAGVAGKKRMLN